MTYLLFYDINIVSQENAEKEAALITDFAPLVTKLLGSNREVYEEEI